MSIKLKRLRLEDKDRFDRAYSVLNMPLADLSFSMMYVWDAFLNVRWMDINHNLCVFTDFENSTVLWGPPLPGFKLEETINKCFEVMNSENREMRRSGQPKIFYVPPELVKTLQKVRGFNLLPQDQDFVYTSKSLIDLKGGKFKKKRNMYNHFRKNYNYDIVDFNSECHTKGCQKLLRKWKEQKFSKIRESVKTKFEAESLTAEKTIDYAECLGLKGVVVIVEGMIEGFTFGDKLNEKMANIMVEKTNLNIKGLSQFIYREFVRMHWAGYHYINAGEDWGVDYLTQSKRSYQPETLLKSFSLVKGGK